MTTNPAARAVLDNAQATLEQAQADLTTFDGFLPWLQQAVARVRDLEKFSLGPGQEHLATIVAADERAVTPPVANEDAVWEVSAEWDDRLRRLLRFVTAELTAGLDDSD